MNPQIQKRRGYTMVEMLVVIVILSILFGIGFVYYTRSIEETRAEQAASLVRQIAMASHMYSITNQAGAPNLPPSCYAMNPGNYPSGQITNVCNTVTTCYHNQNRGGNAPGGKPKACELIACGYLKGRDWDSLPYSVYVMNPGDTPSTVCGSNLSGTSGQCYVACAVRTPSPPQGPPSPPKPYSGWAYIYDYSADKLTSIGGAP